jgi:adenine-specific DNA-methyltransferase
MSDLRESIQSALASCAKGSLANSAKALFNTLGYESDRTASWTLESFIELGASSGKPLTAKEQTEIRRLKSLDLIFQVGDAELSKHVDLFDSSNTVDAQRIQSYIFFAADLPHGTYTRGELTTIARLINKPLPMPAIVLFRHGEKDEPLVSIAIIRRRLNKRDAAKDVLDKATLIKDIRCADPIRAHIEILHDFSLPSLREFDEIPNFVKLHAAWEKKLDSYALSNAFYREIADWYFWALHQVEDGTIRLPEHCDTEQEKSLFLIRLLTRMIFCWFLVEKRLIPADLFRVHSLQKLIKDFHPSSDPGKRDSSSAYYHAILQNLFFGTLNMPPEQRGFRERKKEGERFDPNFGITTLWRHESTFHDSTAWTAHAKRVPFLNGGLFDCLDDKSGKKTDNTILDGFSDNSKLSCHLPNDLFFGPERPVNLSKDYGEENKRTARSKKAKVRGLVEILSRYKFTIEENTPLEEEIALDPELLGKVFENLLASYNEDTKTTARKALGAFYTPREIVSYMVDESLKFYLTSQVPKCKGALEDLFSNKATLKEIQPVTRTALIDAIGRVKILDPACGSGAFPMGALHRLVDLLQKLDPDNDRWREVQRQRAIGETELAFKSGDRETRELRLKEINDTFEFNSSDYGRKLYLIENAIYGVDIQPVAVQIAKLRFFIALVVDQRVSPEESNLGVRPLPNLETRLVAADTLIPIPRPKLKQASLFGDDAASHKRVEELKQRLQAVRHEHFNAREPRKKRVCKEQDQSIRAELGIVLSQTGMDAPAAAKLAAWDPYDQNTFAPFFDSEWMFGLPVGKVPIDSPSAPATLRGNLGLINETSGQTELTESAAKVVDSGFDVVIGNPPYGIRFLSEQKRQLSAIYPPAAKTPDSYAFFVLQGTNLLRRNGTLAYIIPNTFCDLENADVFRRHLLVKTAIQRIWQSGWVFSAAVVDTLVLLLEITTPPPDHEISVTTDECKTRKRQADFLDAPLAKIDFRSSDAVLRLKEKLRLSTNPLSFDFYVKAGVKMYELGKGTPTQSAEVVATKPFSITGKCPKDWKVLYRGGDVAPFLLSDSGERVAYGPWLAAPRAPGLFESPKILMRRTDDRLRSCLEVNDAICVNSCHVIKLHNSGENTIEKYLATLAVLNSKVCQWAFEAENPQMIGKTFAEIKVIYVERLPLPAFEIGQLNVLRPLVQILLFLNEAFHNSREQSTRDPLMLAYWERVLNGLVYELYFPEDVHGAGLRLFGLVENTKLPDVNSLTEQDRLPRLRQKFEELHDGAHLLRIALDKLQTLDTVRIIEGKV